MASLPCLTRPLIVPTLLSLASSGQRNGHRRNTYSFLQLSPCGSRSINKPIRNNWWWAVFMRASTCRLPLGHQVRSSSTRPTPPPAGPISRLPGNETVPWSFQLFYWWLLWAPLLIGRHPTPFLIHQTITFSYFLLFEGAERRPTDSHQIAGSWSDF